MSVHHLNKPRAPEQRTGAAETWLPRVHQARRHGREEAAWCCLAVLAIMAALAYLLLLVLA